MCTLRNKLIALAAVGILAVVGSLMNSHNATAQTAPTTTPPGGPTVTIGAPLPLPVSLTGSNTITGTVQVGNTPTSAVPTVAASAASQLYVAQCGASYNGTRTAECTFPAVPAGQTLFIETESAISASSHGADPTDTLVEVSFNRFMYVPMAQQASSSSVPGISGVLDFFAGTVAARIWVKAGTTPACRVELSNGSSDGSISCFISGYLAPAQ